LVDDTGQRARAFAQRVVGGRRDAVDHGAGADDFRFDPAREIGIGCFCELDQRPVQYRAVLRQVVATENGIGRNAQRPTATQPLDQPPEGAAGSPRVGEIVRDVGIRNVELVARIEAVALFGDGQRHDAGIPRRETRERGFGVGRTDEHFADRADDPCARRSTELEQRVQALLGGQRIAQARALERQRGDRPALVRVQQGVCVEGLVRAMKSARADVHDAETRGPAIVGRQNRARADRMQARL
jgi:hypothetical protein